MVQRFYFDTSVFDGIFDEEKVDILVSWNFKHIVNIFRIRGYNSVNLKLGHGTLEIRSPREIVSNDNED